MGTGQIRLAAVQLPRDAWRAYLHGIDAREGLLASVVLGTGEPALRNGGVVRRLRAISYDAGADAIVVAVGDPGVERPFLRYFVSAPRSIAIEEHADVKAITIVDACDKCTLIRLYPESVTLRRESCQHDDGGAR